MRRNVLCQKGIWRIVFDREKGKAWYKVQFNAPCGWVKELVCERRTKTDCNALFEATDFFKRYSNFVWKEKGMGAL